MKSVTYAGGLPAVDLVLPSGRTQTVRRGETVDVPEELVLGDEWKLAAVPPPPKPPKTATAAPEGAVTDG